MAERHPAKVFISYSWDDDSHREWVRNIAARLRTDGIDIILDLWHALPGDQLPEFMEQAVRESDYVLCICTPRYKEKSEHRLGGVGYEGDVLTGEVFINQNQRKFIPILRSGEWNESAPAWLWGKYYIDLRGESYNESNYQDLMNTLRSRRGGAPPVIEPPGDKPPGKFLEDSSDEVSFTAFHPKEGNVDSWYTLLVYIHLLSAIEKVRRDAKRVRDQLHEIKEISSSSSAQITRGTEITIVPNCEGITFNPSRTTIKWMEDFHRANFRFLANKSLVDDAAKGTITIYVGPLIVGTVKFAMLFNDANEISLTEVEVRSRMYHRDKIFISYSHKDTDIALAFKKVHEATGYDVLIDIDDLRSGQEWNSELMNMIDRADIFQLFWSKNSKKSKYCEQEWRHALSCSKEEFIRPLYWQTPLPKPPKELSKYHFEYVEL